MQYKNLTDVDNVEEINDNDTIFVSGNGAVRQVTKKTLFGGIEKVVNDFATSETTQETIKQSVKSYCDENGVNLDDYVLKSEIPVATIVSQSEGETILKLPTGYDAKNKEWLYTTLTVMLKNNGEQESNNIIGKAIIGVATVV